MGEVLEVSPGLDPARTEELRSVLERRLLGMHAELDAITGFSDAEPLQAPVGTASLAS
jgi:hypothetical protein